MPTPADENRLISFIRDRMVRQAAGSLILDGARRPTEFLVGARPKDKFFVGQLRGQPADDEDLGKAEFRSKVTPSSMTVRFMLDKVKASGSGSIDFLVYYRVIPTYAQQRGAYTRSAKVDPAEVATAGLIPLEDASDEEAEDEAEEVIPEAVPAEPAVKPKRRGGERIALAYRRIPIHVDLPKLEFDASGLTQKSIEAANTAIETALEAARAAAASDRRLYTEQHVEVRLLPDVMKLEADFEKAVKVKGTPTKPDWKVALSSQILRFAGEDCVSVSLTNLATDDKNAEVTENSIFSPDFRFRFDAGLRPFTFNVIPDDFRHDRKVWVHAINCSAEPDADRKGLQSTHCPRFDQRRFLPSGKHVKVAPKFALLAADPIPVLNELVDAMRRYDATTWAPVVERYPAGNVHRQAVVEARGKFQKEIARVQDGLDLLKANPMLLRAFKLMNETMAEMAAGQYEAWRTFQIAFIVTMAREVAASGEAKNVPDPASPGKDVQDTVDIIYFPTGGGKTECYLGLVAFQAFYDRLRGKGSGVTAWARFPLRLLGLQQFQRIFKTMHFAERVRKKQGIKGAPFSVGLLVGDGATPNKLDEAQIEKLRDKTERERYRLVFKCPECGGETAVRYRPETARLEHFCTAFAAGKCTIDTLPVYVTDEEVFRYAPTVLVGTIDKLALTAMQAHMSILLGYATHVCERHGFALEGRCVHGLCKLPLQPLVPSAVPSPMNLLIQDELHLLRESLGTFDGHYEGILQQLVAHSPRPGTLKVIAATATIERFAEQCYHLYRKGARRFPEEGPAIGESFYAETKDEVRRQFAGLMPFGVTHIQAMMDLLYYFHRDIQLLGGAKPNDPLWQEAGLAGLPEKETRTLLLNTEPSLSYFTSKSEGDRVATSLEAQVDIYLTDEGLRPLRQQSLTGETEFEEVNMALENLERPPTDFAERIQAITATSMVSHGVDVARLNFMAFFGMPQMNAEYVQSSSRVGRNYTGLVLCLYRPSRERDRSHFHLHSKYHEFLDRLIEPVAINRYSRFSIERTIAGLVSTYFVNHLQPKFYGKTKSLLMTRGAKEAITKGQATVEKCIAFVLDAYGRDDEVFTSEVKRLVTDIFDRILGAPKPALDPRFGKSIGDLLANPRNGETRLVVMRSLRDTDATVPFEPSRDSEALAKGAMK